MNHLSGGVERGERCSQGGEGERGGGQDTTPGYLNERKVEELKAPLCREFSR